MRLTQKVARWICYIVLAFLFSLSLPSFSRERCVVYGEPEPDAYDPAVKLIPLEDGSIEFRNGSSMGIGLIAGVMMDHGQRSSWELDLMEYGKPTLRSGESVTRGTPDGWREMQISTVRKYPCITTAAVYQEVYSNCLITEMRGIADDGTQARVRQKCKQIASEPSIYERWKYSD